MSTAERRYAERRDRFSARVEELSGRLGRLRTARIVSFLTALVLLLAAEWTAASLSTGLAAGGVASGVVFAVLVVRHRRLRRERERLEHLVDVNREARARLRREWDALPEVEDDGGNRERNLTDHPYADDLDVVGRTSVLRLLSTVTTAAGVERIRGWLLERAEPGDVASRQEAVRSVAPEVDARQEWVARARQAGVSPEDRVGPFLEWAEDDAWLEGRPWLLWTARLLPLTNAGLAAAHATGATAYPWWLLGLVAALAVSGVSSTRIHPVFDRVTRGEENAGRHAPLLEIVDAVPGEGGLLDGARRAVSGPPDAAGALERLEKLISASDVRRNALAHLPLQLLFLWDVHLLWLLERWQRRFGDEARDWFEALGRVDAVLALSVLDADHDDWSYPEVDAAAESLEAADLGHPLLSPEECVRNDVKVGPSRTFLLVTGSNMSGKSTLLRSLGLAAVLAQAGAPVPAGRLRIPPLEVHTSMQVEDSLSEGISEFMAELRRMRQVVQGAEAAGDGPARALYLLDEPLQGTNEAERREGIRIVLRRLVDSGAIGAVATHDLRVHHTPELEPAADVVHLTGDVSEGAEGPLLSFDYRVRPGPAPSTNALALMRAVGLSEEDGSSRRSPG